MGKNTERTNAHQDVTAETLTASRQGNLGTLIHQSWVTLETLTGHPRGRSPLKYFLRKLDN